MSETRGAPGSTCTSCPPLSPSRACSRSNASAMTRHCAGVNTSSWMKNPFSSSDRRCASLISRPVTPISLSACLVYMARSSFGRLYRIHAGGASRRRARQEEEGETEHEVDGQELHALQPVGPSVVRDLARDQHGQED